MIIQFFTVLFFAYNYFFSPPLGQEEAIVFLDEVEQFFDQNYAMKELKKEKYGWDPHLIAEELRHDLACNPDANPYMALNRFFLSTKDYHVQIMYLSGESSYLPFKIMESKGNYYVIEETDSLKLGDQILAINGVPIHEVVSYFYQNFTTRQDNEFDNRLAEKYVTTRFGLYGMYCPRGNCIVKTGRGEVELEWVYSTQLGDALPLIQHSKKETALPPMGEIIWEADPILAYQARIYRNKEGLRIGFLRIHTFYCEDPQPLHDFQSILEVLESQSDCLVIDHLDNDGGEEKLMYGMLTSFAKEPMRPLLLQVTFPFSRQWMWGYWRYLQGNNVFLKNMEDEWAEYGVELDPELQMGVIEYARHLFTDYWDGKFLSRIMPLEGINAILPSKGVRYTKPVVILINGKSVSCGDIFPAIMKENGRALLIGTKTGGAGGAVLVKYHYLKNEIPLFSYTESIGYSPDGNLIENEGTAPDIEYPITFEEIKNGYKGLLKVIESNL